MPELVDTEQSAQCAGPGRSCLNDDEVLDFVAGRLSHDRLQAINAHLDQCAVCRKVVGAALRDTPNGEISGELVQEFATMFRPGDVVAGRYRVQRFVARGGMGEVYDAYDRDLQKRIALKTVLSSVCDNQRAVRLLKAEVQLAHRVSHANVCRIYDLGSHCSDGGSSIVHFLTMEFVEGERLTERLQRGALPVGDAVAIARQLLHGLQAAHRAGILHRDLKSDNVMLRASASKGELTPVILDFGLARTIELDVARVTSGINGLAGTPCYMAPEQLEAGELTTATDMYAFGIIFFEMLTAELPFSMRLPFDRLRKRAPRPSSVSPDVPANLDKVVLRCLERLPANRFSRAGEVLESLDAVEQRIAPADAVGASPRSPSKRVLLALLCAMSIALLAFVLRPREHVPATPTATSFNALVPAPVARAPVGRSAEVTSTPPAPNPSASADVARVRAQPRTVAPSDERHHPVRSRTSPAGVDTGPSPSSPVARVAPGAASAFPLASAGVAQQKDAPRPVTVDSERPSPRALGFAPFRKVPP